MTTNAKKLNIPDQSISMDSVGIISSYTFGNTNERFDEQFTDVILDQELRTVVPGVKTFISQEKNLLLDQAIEVLEELKKGRYQYDVAYDEAISKLKELKE